MLKNITIKELLEKAIAKEIESQKLYRGLGRRVADGAARDACRDLTREEKHHQDVLEQYQRREIWEGALNPGKTADYRIAEHFYQPTVSRNMKLEDIFLLAANREKASHEFYASFAALHPAGKMKMLIEDLAAQELAHKHRVETLYTEVAFPQTDGG